MRNDEVNQREYDDMARPDIKTPGTNRYNQDKYDVIQAKEEFESMLDPRTNALKERIEELEDELEDLKENCGVESGEEQE